MSYSNVSIHMISIVYTIYQVHLYVRMPFSCSKFMQSHSFLFFLLAGIYISKQYALMLSCFIKDNLEFCLIRQFEEIELNGDAMVNDYHCPLLTLTGNITIISSSIAIQSVSIVHECTSTCYIYHLTLYLYCREREN